MARKKKHEEHVNAEAWAIPYGDLVTLLFALFTVMYAVSSVNEGKFRVLSDAMIAAFRGAPKSLRPVNIGEKESGKGGDKQLAGVTPTVLMKLTPNQRTIFIKQSEVKSMSPFATGTTNGGLGNGRGTALERMAVQVEAAMQDLIDTKLVRVRRGETWLEVEIATDILFPSGSAGFADPALPVLDKLAEVLKPFPNAIRVEGHTDDRPIHTAAYPSNWELSAARAASVVHEFTKAGIDPLRLEIVGFGEYRPAQPNGTESGRNANRRVGIVVLGESTPIGGGDVPIAGGLVLPKGTEAPAMPAAPAAPEGPPP